jgi:hypothetical protein
MQADEGIDLLPVVRVIAVLSSVGKSTEFDIRIPYRGQAEDISGTMADDPKRGYCSSFPIHGR